MDVAWTSIASAAQSSLLPLAMLLCSWITLLIELSPWALHSECQVFFLYAEILAKSTQLEDLPLGDSHVSPGIQELSSSATVPCPR